MFNRSSHHWSMTGSEEKQFPFDLLLNPDVGSSHMYFQVDYLSSPPSAAVRQRSRCVHRVSESTSRCWRCQSGRLPEMEAFLFKATVQKRHMWGHLRTLRGVFSSVEAQSVFVRSCVPPTPPACIRAYVLAGVCLGFPTH